jgi:C-terminal processing protease CtpA/Prc
MKLILGISSIVIILLLLSSPVYADELLKGNISNDVGIIGIEFSRDWTDHNVMIRRVFPSSPAESACLKKDDVIGAVDGVEVGNRYTAELNLDRVRELFNGPPGSLVVIRIKRNHRWYDVTVQRINLEDYPNKDFWKTYTP